MVLAVMTPSSTATAFSMGKQWQVKIVFLGQLYVFSQNSYFSLEIMSTSW